jgi:hypothetical protein
VLIAWLLYTKKVGQAGQNDHYAWLICDPSLFHTSQYGKVDHTQYMQREGGKDVDG